jgi:cytochrome P450
MTDDLARDARAAELLAALATPTGLADPYPVYAELRALGPARRVGRHAVVVTQYAECAAVLSGKSFGALTSAWRDGSGRPWRDNPAYADISEFMIFRDPPEHTRLRGAFGAFFAPARVSSLRAAADRIAAGLVADFAARIDRDGTADFIEHVAALLPMRIIGMLLGIPVRDQQWLEALLARFALTLEFAPTAEELRSANEAALTLRDYMRDLLAGDAFEEGDNALTAWTRAARSAAEDLTLDEVARTVPILFSAGSSPARLLTGNLLNLLLTSPAHARQLQAAPGLADGAATEGTRLDPPIQLLSRLASGATEIGGVPVRPGDRMVLLVGSANRDPLRYPEPDQADFTRDGARPLSYSLGIHHCLGAGLATMQTAALLRAVADRIPGWQFAGPPVRYPGRVFRGFDSMPLRQASEPMAE